jgi:HTH-type transcriptional regulator/antitoxin HigA
MLAEIKTAQSVWPQIESMVFVPHAEIEYKQLVSMLDLLIDTVGENEAHPLASLMEVIGVLIEKYEDEHVAELADI